MTAIVALTVLGVPVAAGEVTQALGLPIWAELASPAIAGAFALAAIFVRDWLQHRLRNKSGQDERELLIQQLLQDVDDARAGEARAQQELDGVCRQRDRLQREVDRLRGG